MKLTLDEKGFILLLIINAIITIIYFVVAVFFKKTNRHLAYIRSVIMLLAPLVGALFIFFGWFGYEFIFRKDVDLSDVVFSKDKEKEIVRTNEEIERNIVPLEEAIAISNNKDLRSLVMGIAQGDYYDSLASISMAINCEDSETAHYAASVLQDALNDFRVRVSKDYEIVKRRDEELTDTAISLIRFMNKLLVQHVFSDVEQVSFTKIMADVGQILYEEHPEELKEDILAFICSRLLEVEEFEQCELWSERSMKYFPEALSSYTNRLKLFFNSNQREKFMEALAELKAAPVIIDSQTLELIRAFS